MREQQGCLLGRLSSRSSSTAIAGQLLYGHNPRGFARFAESSAGKNTKSLTSLQHDHRYRMGISNKVALKFSVPQWCYVIGND